MTDPQEYFAQFSATKIRKSAERSLQALADNITKKRRAAIATRRFRIDSGNPDAN